ncbi:MAG: proton-conducting transporter membrane subunit, partial [Salinisphaeraceae bacterium]|nr:proton-conducting transporter membrane subunit [Salinisphaeraceae bacterium]
YLGYLLLTSMLLLLPAIVAVWATTGTLDFIPGGILQDKVSPTVAMGLYALFLFGTGKAALMPFHGWLPSAMVAPTPVSALLHAVAVVKSGVFVVAKISSYTFGLDFLFSSGAAQPMLWAAVFTMLIASLIAMTKDNLKARLAYSTVSQLAYVVLGATMATSIGLLGSALHMTAHAVGKITLFFCAGAIYTAAKKTEISQLNGLARQMPITFTAFTIAALSIIGLPPLAGFWGKWYLMTGALDNGLFWVVAALAISSLLNIVYLLEIPMRGFFLPNSGDKPAGLREAPLASVIALSITAIACLALFALPEGLLVLLNMWRP